MLNLVRVDQTYSKTSQLKQHIGNCFI